MNANISILVRCCGQLGEFNLSRPTGPRWNPYFLIFATPGRDTCGLSKEGADKRTKASFCFTPSLLKISTKVPFAVCVEDSTVTSNQQGFTVFDDGSPWMVTPLWVRGQLREGSKSTSMCLKITHLHQKKYFYS